SLAYAEANLGNASFWLNTDRPPDGARVHWVGAGTRDTGISLTRLTFQITHATDSDTNAERDYIIDELIKCEVIGEINLYKAGQQLAGKHVNHYITDGEVKAASLAVEG
ncbi:MAG: LssY C-terminal domain-containing protein, partial [Xanthobacteraceae bacterium]